MAAVLREGGIPHLWTFVSPSVGLCQAALEQGIDIRGSQFTLTGEPVTLARLEPIRQAGADVLVDYGSKESGFLAHGCQAPEAPDDVHLFHDLNALVQVQSDENRLGIPAGALLVTSLRLTAPLILLNVSMGDQAVMSQRACGCPLEQLGWVTHLHTIRSYEKLTANGMTLLDTNVIPVLEEVLPAAFGGGATDYQLVEEAENGQARLRLLVHPRIGPIEPEEVADAFLASIGGGSDAAKVVELQWRASGLPSVERRAPHARRGKILHLHRHQPLPQAVG
jgi:hypothetical protein